MIAEISKLSDPPLVKVVDVDSIRELPENGSDVVDLLKLLGAIADSEKKAIIQQYLDEALPTGAHALLISETEDILAGKRNVVDWPWPLLADNTEAVTAGMMTVICGAPGASKSLFLLQAMFEWFKRGLLCAVLQLEDGLPFHLRRAAAMLAQCSFLTSLKWQRLHPDETRRMVNQDVLTAFGRCLHVLPPTTNATVDNLLAWINQQVQRGTRIIAVDPVTLADFGKDLHGEDSKLVRGIKRALEGSMSSFIAVTHPRPGARQKTLDDMALTRDWGRHTQTALWYEFLAAPKRVRVAVNSALIGRQIIEETPNRIVHIKKSRNTGGGSKRIAFSFDNSSLLVKELGEIVD